MLRITVIQFNGSTPASPLSFDFDEHGGTIGREASNQLFLPDPERLISRLQAQIRFANGQFLLVDHGSNPSCVNGRAVGKGNSCPLQDGDELTLGNYVLRAEALRPAPVFAGGPPSAKAAASGGPLPASDPLGLFGDTGTGAAPAAPPAPTRPTADLSAPVQKRTAAAQDDPFAVFAASAPARAEPEPRQTAPIAEDPFSAFGAPPAPPKPVPPDRSRDDTSNPLGLDLGQTAETSSLDELFGLDKAGAKADPLAATPLASPMHAPVAASESQDPLAVLAGESAPSTPPTARDDSPILRDAFIPPRVADQAQPPIPATDMQGPLKPAGGVVSWGAGTLPVQPAPSAPGRDAGAMPTPRAKVSVEGIGDRPEVAPQAERVASVAPAPGNAELLAAFVRGLGVPELKLPDGITPDFMEHVGVMLREAVQGTVELLIARATVKREVRAEVTMIVSRNNNPLKFSPNVDFALTQLLAPQGTGFMSPTEAMRDAYDDLRAHQLGFMAGMRGAIAGMLARFKPEDLEKRLADKSFLDSLLPASRKGKLWDLFEQRFTEISREAEDDFHALFGREFLKAYEAQIERLQEER